MERLVILEPINSNALIEISDVICCLGSDVLDIEGYTSHNYTWEQKLYESVIYAYHALGIAQNNRLYMFKATKEIKAEHNSFCILFNYKIVRVLRYESCKLLVESVNDIISRNEIRKLSETIFNYSKFMGEGIVDGTLEVQCDDDPEFAEYEFDEQFRFLFPIHHEFVDSIQKLRKFESEITEIAMDFIEGCMQDILVDSIVAANDEDISAYQNLVKKALQNV